MAAAQSEVENILSTEPSTWLINTVSVRVLLDVSNLTTITARKGALITISERAILRTTEVCDPSSMHPPGRELDYDLRFDGTPALGARARRAIVITTV